MAAWSLRRLVSVIVPRRQHPHSGPTSRTSSEASPTSCVGAMPTSITTILNVREGATMDDPQRFDHERHAIIQAQQFVETAQRSAQLFQQQVDTLIHTLQVDEWGAYQEYKREQQQNALEYTRDQQRQMER